MTCQDFLARFSQFYDGILDASEEASFRAHADECESCRRYTEVVRRGTTVLRDLPPPRVSTHFHSRLQHRLYHLADGPALGRGAGTSGTTAVTVLAMAVVLGAAAWSPVLVEATTAEVELPPVVVTHPQARSTFLRPRPTPELRGYLPSSGPVLRADARTEALWSQPNAMLYRYSPLSGRSRSAGAVQAGID